MAHSFNFTPAQREVMKQIYNGMIIKHDGHGYSLRSADGQYIGKASIAVKTLGRNLLVASTGKGEPIFFSTRGWRCYCGGEPTGEIAEHCKRVDAHIAYIQSMIVES